MKYIIWIIVIVAIIFVWKSYFQDKPVDTLPANTEVSEEINTTVADNLSDAVVVTYTDSGFTPPEITVKNGQTVQFVNQSGKNMWVASAFHPKHEVFPEFDQKISVGNGEMYEFTFTKTGEWKYHNHVRPSDFGTIIVK